MKATIPSYHQIKRGLELYEQIERLQNDMAKLFGVKSVDQVPALLSGASSDAPKRRGRPPKAISTGKRGRKKAEESASQSSQGDVEAPKKRGRKPEQVAGKKPKRKISETHRQAIIAAQKKRWAAKKGE